MYIESSAETYSDPNMKMYIEEEDNLLSHIKKGANKNLNMETEEEELFCNNSEPRVMLLSI